MRTYRAVYPNLQRMLLAPLRSDVFVHVWDLSGETHKRHEQGAAIHSRGQPATERFTYADRIPAPSRQPPTPTEALLRFVQKSRSPKPTLNRRTTAFCRQDKSRGYQ